MLSTYWNLVQNEGRFALDGHIRFTELSAAPGTLLVGSGHWNLYAKSGGLYYEDDNGVETGPLSAATVFGSGAANKVAYWTNTTTISSDTNFHWDATNDRLGIGTIAPAQTLHAVLESSSGLLPTFDNYSTAGGTAPGGAFLTVRAARNTAASPAAVQADDSLGGIRAIGYGTSFPSGAKGLLSFRAAETWTGSNNGTYMIITATPTGSSTAAERLRITGIGNIFLNEVASSPASIHPTLTTFITQLYRNSTSIGPDLQFANEATADQSSLGAMTWGTKGASNSDERGALIHARLIGSGATHPCARLEFYTRIAGGTTFNTMYFSELGQLGIGVAPSSAIIHAGANNQSAVQLDGLATVFAPTFMGRAFRTSLTSPSAVQADDTLAHFTGAGRGATGYSAGKASIVCSAGENWTDSAQGTYLTLQTTPLLSTTRAERFRVGPAGQLGIGGATYGTAGNVLTSAGSAAAPTWSEPVDSLRASLLLMGG